MKKLLAFILVLALCIPCFSAIQLTAVAVSSHVYTIVTNPGENMNTQMNISFHADEGYTGCYVEYTTAGDTSFSAAKKNYGEKDTDDYLWFYNRHTTTSNSSARYTTKFIHYNVYLTDLTPNTDYIYRICDGKGAYSATYSFKTAGQSKFSILWTSDMHLSSTETTKIDRFNATVEYLESIADYDIGLHYNSGDTVASGERHTFWETLYSQPVFKKYTYAATVGNHDLFDSMMKNDELYTHYWNGGEYFRITANYPKNSYVQTSSRISGYLSSDGYSSYVDASSSQLFDPGTGTLSGMQITGAKEDLNGRTYWFIYNRVLFIVFDYYAQTATSEINTAFAWANQVIEQNKGKYDYLIASEHLNLFWGDSGADRYYSRYQAWLDSANVDVFICGDNHIYFRTANIVNGVAQSDKEKGTYVLQASAITNTTTYPTYTGAAGTGVNRYSSANYLGGAVLNFDENGLTVKAAVNSAGSASASDFSIVDTFTIPMKTRERVYEDSKTGYYTAASALTLKETADASAQTLTTIPSGTVFTVDTVSGNYGRISYGGYTGWANLSGLTPNYETSDVTVPASFAVDNINVGYTSAALLNAYTPSYGATIANGNWSLTYQRTITAVRDSTGAYKVTEQNLENVAKNTTAIPANGCVLLINSNYASYASLIATLSVGSYFTLDSGKVLIYPATPGAAYTAPVIPGTEPEEPTELVLADGSAYTLDDYVNNVSLLTTVSQLTAQFTNSDVRVSDSKGNTVTGNALVATGYVVSCYVDGTATQSKTVVVKGDIDGDGACSTSDYITLSGVIKETATVGAANLRAADLAPDGMVNSADYIALAAMIKS